MVSWYDHYGILRIELNSRKQKQIQIITNTSIIMIWLQYIIKADVFQTTMIDSRTI